MTSMNGFPVRGWRSLPYLGLVVLAGLAAHGLLFFTDHVIWDGWWYAADLSRPEGPTSMARLFHEVGRPLDMLFYLPFRHRGDSVILAKWLGVAAWIGSAVFMEIVMVRLGRMPAAVATAIAVLAVTAPVFDLLGELALWMNTACVFLFWLAWVLVTLMKDANGWRRIALRISAIAVFFISFDLNSQLVMFYAVAAFLFALRLPALDVRTLRDRLPRAAVRHADFLALPVVFWLWKTFFTATSGFYSGYNKPSIDPLALSSGYASMAMNLVVLGLLELFASPNWIAAAIAVGVAVAVATTRWNASAVGVMAPLPARGAWFAGMGGMLLVAAAFPYIAVGQNLASEGWLTRNGILCSLPVALLFMGAAVGANRMFLPGRPVAWMIGVCVIAVLCIGNCQRNYLALQGFGAKQRSIQDKLRGAVAGSRVCVIQLRDYYQIPATIPFYPPLIWTSIAGGGKPSPETFVIETASQFPDQIARDVNGEQRRVVPQLPLSSADVDQAITQTTMPYALQLVPRTGPQKLVTIMPGKHGNDGVSLGILYLWLKWFDRAKVGEFLESLTESQAFDLPRIGG